MESQMRSVKSWIALLVTTMIAAVASAAVAPSAMAISSDYCGYGRAAGEPFCFEGSGYRGWRYHQASTGSGGVLVTLCVRAYGSHGAYRVNECSPDRRSFYAAKAYCSAEPTTNSSVGWTGSGTVTLYGHADSRTDACRLGTPSTSVFPDVVADRFRDPESAGQAGVLPSTARAIGSGQGAVLFTLVGDEQRCMVLVEKGAWGGTCTTAKQLAADRGQQLVTGVQPDGGYRVYGLFGDGIETASVLTADGKSYSVAVSAAGAGIVDVPTTPASVSVMRAEGTTSTALPALG